MAQSQTEKRHAACDECRTRKLKCSGEQTQCSRCQKEGIACIYSPQKQMGRPRKRRREDPEASTQAPEPNAMDFPSNGFSDPDFEDLGLIPPTDFNAMTRFPSIHEHENMLTPSSSHDHMPSATLGSQTTLPFDHYVDAIDPSLWDPNSTVAPVEGVGSNSPEVSANTPCTCLATMYLALTDLQSMTSFTFPVVVPRLRSAINTSLAILQCDKCPRESFSAIQNVLTMSSLMGAIAERFHRVLKGIDEEAVRLEETGQKKAFRVGDNSPDLVHLHTGTLDCPMGFNVDLDPEAWRKLAKQVMKTEVLGKGSNPNPLINVVDQMEERQHKWHSTSQGDDIRERMFGHRCPNAVATQPKEAHCLNMVKQVRVVIENMNFD